MEDFLIEIDNLTFAYQAGKTVLSELSFKIAFGETVGIVGANGAGKSTFLRLLVGLESGFDGHLVIDDLEVNKKNILIIRKVLGYVFQDADSQMFLSTVKDNVAFGPANYGLKGEEVEKAVNEALEKMGILHLANRPIYQLSGGEKKLASIATVMSMKPKALLMDEPSVALDPKNRRNLIRQLNDLPQTKIIASHDLDFILDTCQRVLLFSDGKIVADGPAKEVLSNKELLEQCSLELPLSYQRR